MKAHHAAIMLLVLILAAGCQQTADTGAKEPDIQKEYGVSDDGHDEAAGELRTFEITAKQFEFVPNTITVKQGDFVDMHIKSADITHGFSLPGYGINKMLQPGKTVHVEFVADKKGTFQFFCSVPCGSGHDEMSGMLIVE